MPEVTIQIGGRGFEVSCQDGEQKFLKSAAKMLDEEAQVLADQIGRMPEARMLLMAGLMLADKTAALEDRVAAFEARLAEKEAELGAKDAELIALRSAPTAEPERVEVKVEVPVVPPLLNETLAQLAVRAEIIAQEVEEKIPG